jgi:hypothetical protein
VEGVLGVAAACAGEEPQMTRARSTAARFWIETGLAALTAFLFLLTLVWSEWIEFFFGVDPDGGDGSLEWAIVAALFVISVTFAVLARADRRRLAALRSSPETG